MTLSLFWIDFSGDNIKTNTIANSKHIIDSIADRIYNTPERRQLSAQFDELGKYGDVAVNRLIMFLDDADPVKREFAANQLGHIKNKLAVEPLLQAIDDENWRVRNSSAIALAEIGDERAIIPIMGLLEQASPNGRAQYYGTLGSLKAKEAWPYLSEDVDNPEWYVRTAVLQAMTDIDFGNARPYIYDALKDDEVRVRRQAVFILLEKLPLDAMAPLTQVLDDKDFEVSFYARQALNRIEKNKKSGGIK
jgi:HEAT repeat protein